MRKGFRVGYFGPEFSFECPNLKSVEEHPDVMVAYMEKEVKLGHISGPYLTLPFPNFQCNPLGVVPKKTPGKWRSILHLSYPPGRSVNDFIDKDSYSLQYVAIDHVICHIKSLGTGCFLSKVVIECAFRIAPVHPDDWHLGMKFNNQCYFDMRLSMGSRSSPYNFDTIGQALEFICKVNYLIQFVEHLLDDFITVEPGSEPPTALQIIIELFLQALGIPLAPEKMFGPTACLDFLGITLDTILMEAWLPQDKVSKLLMLISDFKTHKKCTK